LLRTALQLARLPFLLQLIPGVLQRCLNMVAKRKVTVIKENLITADETNKQHMFSFFLQKAVPQ
jgi:phage terminase Nu1 subunit (DNA packaging protein)